MATHKATVTACKHVMLELKLATSTLENEISTNPHPEYVDRLKIAQKSIAEAVVQINIVQSQAAKK